jgi:hypothetical protein
VGRAARRRDPGQLPARVIRDDRGSVVAAGSGWERRLALPRGLHPVAGDWIAVRDDEVVAVLERATAVARPRPDGGPQVLAANTDLVGVVHGLDVPSTAAVWSGASGAGKSSLVNALLGREQLATSAVREGDRKGRHTTTHRELVVLSGGGAPRHPRPSGPHALRGRRDDGVHPR